MGWAEIRMIFDKISFCALLFVFILSATDAQNDLPCSMPQNTWGSFFSRENGRNTITVIDGSGIEGRGNCVDIDQTRHSNITVVLQNRDRSCSHCVRILVRTLNVLEKIETGCVNLHRSVRPTLKTVCQDLDNNRELITLFAENARPKNCRSSLEGVWRFSYQRQDEFTGECKHPEANITACQTPGSQFFIINQQFYMYYRKCEGMSLTFDAEVQFGCLGDWFVGKNHYFAVLNVRESRPEEKYRCFLRNRDDDYFAALSITAECNTLETPQKGPERLRMEPVKQPVVVPRCKLPDNFTGEWIDTAKLNAKVNMNSTHMEVRWRPDQARINHEIYVCHERRGDRYVLARLGIQGCQKDYVCYEFLPRHHSLIRYRKGRAMIKDDFHTVCSWKSFQNKANWQYSLLILKDPVPVQCPVAGKFRFTQKGEVPFETRIRGGATSAPRPGTYCKQNISDFSVCDTNQKTISVDANYCLTVNEYGLPVDIYSDPDFVMKCVGYYQENLKSYLITYDPLDAFTSYRCWVYQRADLNKVIMSQSFGAFCDLGQDVYSDNYTEGAAVSLFLEEYEREFDNCPMHFDDGSNPWNPEEKRVKVFKFDKHNGGSVEDQSSKSSVSLHVHTSLLLSVLYALTMLN